MGIIWTNCEGGLKTMLEMLQYILSGLWPFVGTLLLVTVISVNLTMIGQAWSKKTIYFGGVYDKRDNL